MRTLATVLLALTLTACPPPREAPSPHPLPVPDTELIPGMCKHLGPKDQGGLGCDDGNPVYNSDLPGPAGVPNQSCVDFYTGLQNNGYFVNPKCVLSVTACDQVEAARQKTCP
jgi:hypothetical protein